MKNIFKKLAIALSVIAIGLIPAFGLTACDSSETIVVYTEAGFPPFEYISGGKIVGADVDIMNLVGDKLGKKIRFEDVSFDMIIDTVSKGKLCKVGAAGISVTPERAEKVDFSNEYYTANLYVIYNAAEENSYLSETTDGTNGVYWESLGGKTIAVQKGTTADLFLGDELAESGTLYGTGANVSRFDELALATADINKNSDVLIIDELPAQKLIENDSSLKCAPLYYQGGEGEDDEPATDVYAICVTKGETEILTAINEVLDELGQTGIEALVQKHLGIN